MEFSKLKTVRQNEAINTRRLSNDGDKICNVFGSQDQTFFFTLLGNTSCNLPYPFKYVHMYVALFYVYICLSVSCCLSISIYLHLLRVYFYTLFRLCLPACYVCMRTCPHTDIYTYIQSLIFATNNCMKYRCICINII